MKREDTLLPELFKPISANKYTKLCGYIDSNFIPKKSNTNQDEDIKENLSLAILSNWKQSSNFESYFQKILDSIHDNIKKFSTTFTKKTYWGQILEISEFKVTIRCLIDEENQVFQLRKFDKTPFEGAVTLEINNFVEINIWTGVGERRFIYKNVPEAKLNELQSIFKERKNYFEGLENSPFFNPPK